MTARIAGLGCVCPDQTLDQPTLCRLAQDYSGDDATHRRLVERIFNGSTIRRRASVLLEHDPAGNGHVNTADDPLDVLKDFYADPRQSPIPGTGRRMAEYEARALPLAARAARAALDDACCDPSTITHIIAVSCTGFAAPGLEVRLIDALGLPPTVARTCVGFMGCHAAVNALRLARAIVLADPSERVLVVCVELCTLHFQYGDNPQHAVANALFADGAGAAVVHHADDASDQPALHDTRSCILHDSADQMGWRIGDHGFEMYLSQRLSATIRSSIAGLVVPWLSDHGLTVEAVGGWAIHPGGPKVIDAVEAGLGLPTVAGDVSRQVLADHGNMSSPTVLFILERFRRQGVARPWVTLAFGPGLAVEAALVR